MNTMLYAGYILPSVYDVLVTSGIISREALQALLQSWCTASFEANVDMGAKRTIDDAVLMTAANMVSRGLPTLPSVETEQSFHDAFGRTSLEQDDTGRILSQAHGINGSLAERILDGLKAVEPTLKAGSCTAALKKSKAAVLLNVLTGPFQDLFGPAVVQLLDVDDSGKSLLLTFPCPLSGMKGIRAFAEKASETAHPGGLDANGWYVLPVIAGDAPSLKGHLKAIRARVPSDAIPIVVHDQSILNGEGAEAVQLALAPIAIGRIQRALLDIMLAGKLDLAAASWHITVIERDIPGAALAVKDLQRLLSALFLLEGKNRSLPAIKLSVYSPREFHSSALHKYANATVVTDPAKLAAADCVIDSGVLLRSGLPAEAVTVEAPVQVILRTAKRNTEARKFHLREPIQWKSLQMKNGKPSEDVELQNAVEHLLQRCFRFVSFRPGQFAMLDHALRQQSWLASMPAGAGKSLMYQFAGLLQPALSFVLEPLASLAMDQQDSLQDRFIDAVACLHESLGKDDRQAVRERFAGGEALFCIVTAELFRNEEVVEVLKRIEADSVCFAQCVIDEAHSLSEWSHDHRLTMQCAMFYAVNRFKTGKKMQLPLRLLTANTSYDVLRDLQRQLSAVGKNYTLSNAQLISIPSALNNAIRYYVLPAPTEHTDEEAVATVKKETLNKLLKRLPTFFEEMQENAAEGERLQDFDAAEFYSPSRPHAGVVYCPYPSGALGVTNRFSSSSTSKAVAESLTQSFLRTGSFVGKDDGNTHVGRQLFEDAAAERVRFKNGDSNLLVATRAYGIGSHNRRIRYTVHLNMPPGLDRFVQESGRAGHDGRLALSAVLYSPAVHQESSDWTRAVDILAATHSTPEREKQIVHDLLKEISYPEDSNTGRIANTISDEFGVEVRASYWHRGLDERMYLQEAGNNLGYIDLVTQEIVPEPKHADQEYVHTLLTFAFDYSLEAAGSGPSLSSWVSATYPSDVDDGILRQMEDFDTGATFTLRVGFENDREPILTRIHQLLWHDAELEIHRKVLSEVNAESWKEFCRLLEQRIGKPGAFANLDKDLESQLQQLFNKLRGQSDTERAINRLATLGVVKDYSINPAARKFSLIIMVNGEDEYREALEQYLRTFVPVAHVQRLIGSLSSYSGDSILERCLNFLVDFAYDNAVRHREAGVAVMDAACAHGLEHGPAAFREYVDRSLCAKYARSDQLPSSTADQDRFDVIETYLRLLEKDSTGSILENASHLKSSSAILAAQMNGEPVFWALGAFAELLLAETENERSVYTAKFVEAALECASANGLNGSSYQTAIAPLMQLFRRYLDEHDTAALRNALEQGAERIEVQKPRGISRLSQTSRQQPGKTPDLTSEKPLPTQKETSQSRAETKPQPHTATKPQSPPQPQPPPQPVRVREKAASEPPSKLEEKRKPSSEETSKEDREELKPRVEEPVAKKSARPEPSNGKKYSPAKSPVSRSAVGDLDDSSDIDALLADIENAIRIEKSGNEKPRTNGHAENSSRVRHAASDRTAADRAAADRTAADRAAADRAAADLKQRTSAARAAAQHVAVTVAPKPPQVDPLVAHQLKWLLSFNTRFLKDYES